MTVNVVRPAPQHRATTPPIRAAPSPITVPGRVRASSTGAHSPASAGKAGTSWTTFVDSRALGSAATTTPFSFLDDEAVREGRRVLPERPLSSPPLQAGTHRAFSGGGAQTNGGDNERNGSGNGRAATHGNNTPRTGSARRRLAKAGWPLKLLDIDHVLGPLDPNRVARSTAPDPIPIAVFGAETDEGLAVCRELLAAKCWVPIALSVDTSGAAAAELVKLGIRVVRVDMDDPGTYAHELRGLDAVYLATNGAHPAADSR